METITHNLVAVLIQILCTKFMIFPLNIIFTIILAFFSHVFFDAISVITYHTPEKMEDDKFWKWWHIIIYGLSIFTLIFFMIPYWIALFFANIMDLWDWFIYRPIQKKKYNVEHEQYPGKKYYFHIFVDWFRDKFFNWLPRWNYKKGGIIVEILMIIIFSFFIALLI
jgi:hypothetical protein